MAFTKAVKRGIKAKIAVTGPAGSGKTLTALKLAKGILRHQGGGKIAALDSEYGRMNLYADRFDFDTDPSFKAPYSVERYRKGIKEAVEAGYDALIIDSLSHAWAGQGGLLDFVGGRFGGWKEGTPKQHELIADILKAPIHIICTMRSKQDYVIEEREENGRKRQEVRKVGLAPVQGKDIEYELDWQIEMEQETHEGYVSKTRGCEELDHVRVPRPDESLGERIAAFLDGEADAPALSTEPSPSLATAEQLSDLRALQADASLSQKARDGLAEKLAGRILAEDAAKWIAFFRAQRKERPASANAEALLKELAEFGVLTVDAERMVCKPRPEWGPAEEVTLADHIDNLRKLEPAQRKAYLERVLD